MGAGSTAHAKTVHEELITRSDGHLVDSRTFRWWKPNDQRRLHEPNIAVALEMVNHWSKQLGGNLAAALPHK
ncbi:MAG: hypothetical protein INR73_20295 [Williamsia sp.]|nr:hypothetical protein [Williamsia sp.]